MKLTPDHATAEPVAPITHAHAHDAPVLDHERLDVFRVALDFAALVPTLTQATRAPLRDQLERASASICRNIAEGAVVAADGTA